MRMIWAAAFAAVLAGPARAQAGDPFADAVRLTRSADPAERHRGAGALADLRRPEARPVLEGLLASDKDARVRQTAASSLGLLGDPAAAPVLTAALKDASAPVRFAAVRSLGVLRAPAAGPLAALLKDRDPSMRRTAAAALAQIADPASREALKGALADADEGVRLESAGALARLGDASGLEAARAGLKSRDAHARRSAAVAAALAGDASAGTALDDAIRAEKDPGTKAALKDARQRLSDRLAPPKPVRPKAAK